MADNNPYATPEADVDVDDDFHGELAGRWRRFGGWILDGIVLLVIMMPIMFAVGYMETLAAGQESGTQIMIAGLTGFGLFLLINGYLLATSGQTVAKRLLGMRIVSVEDNKILSLLKVVGLRYLPFWIAAQLPGVGAFVGIIDGLFIFGEERRCLHDRIAGTKVVMVDS